jgi:hypothetical protein
MARTLYVASTNPGKLRDFSLAAARQGVMILPLPGLHAIEAPAEDALTFEDNAREKAIYYSRFLPGEMVMADDSGLEVDFLGGTPPVMQRMRASARPPPPTPITIYFCCNNSLQPAMGSVAPATIARSRLPGMEAAR